MKHETLYSAALGAGPTILIALVVQLAIARPDVAHGRFTLNIDRLFIIVGFLGCFVATLGSINALMSDGNINDRAHAQWVGMGLWFAVLALLTVTLTSVTRSPYMKSWRQVLSESQNKPED